MLLSRQQQQLALQRYQGLFHVADLAYGTVRDYCDSCDHFPFLANYQGDLKDHQRPWIVKAVLGTCLPGSKLLEIGAGEPIVAQMLVELGYDVLAVDPYDGSARGPTEYAQFQRLYPGVKVCRAEFSPKLSGMANGEFDCIYSISVLEHLFGLALSTVFEGIRMYLRPRGSSLHTIDHVTAGNGVEFDRRNLLDILNHQFDLGGGSSGIAEGRLNDLHGNLEKDLETYYLSASGHNLWRGRTPYDEFPFRKVVSVLSCAQLLDSSNRRV